MDSSSISGPRPAKGSSKKGKKAWRKNTDLAEVEEFLDDQRLEERLGGKCNFLSAKKSEDSL